MDLLDNDMLTVITILRKKCKDLDYGENKLQCILNLLSELNYLKNFFQAILHWYFLKVLVVCVRV